jgi:Cu/Ag efflux protein CusF
MAIIRWQSERTNPATAAHRAHSKNRRLPMKIAKSILAGTAALAIISSTALAQQALTGIITKIDRIKGTITIQQEQSGTIGASTGDGAEEFKAQNGLSLDAVHAGDKVSFSTAQTGGIKTITKLQKQ